MTATTLRSHNCKITRVEDGFHALCPECGWQDLDEKRSEVRAAATMHSIFQPALDLKPCRDCSGRGFYSSSFGKLTCNVCRGSGKVERPSKYVAPRPTDVLRAE